MPVPTLVEFTVTVDPKPEHTDVAEGDVNTLTLGEVLTVAAVVYLTVHPDPAPLLTATV